MFGFLCANAPCAGNALCENAFSFLCTLVLWQPSGAPRIILRNSDNILPVSCAELPSTTACTNLLIAISCSPLNRIVSRKSRSCRGRGAHARAHAHTNTHTHTLRTGPTKHIRAHTQTPFLAAGGPATRGVVTESPPRTWSRSRERPAARNPNRTSCRPRPRRGWARLWMRASRARTRMSKFKYKYKYQV